MAKKLFITLLAVLVALSFTSVAMADYRVFPVSGWDTVVPGDVVVSPISGTVDCWFSSYYNTSLPMVVVDGTPNLVFFVAYGYDSDVVFRSYSVSTGSVVEFDGLYGMCQASPVELGTPPNPDDVLIQWIF